MAKKPAARLDPELFERLAHTLQRLNGFRDEASLHDFLVNDLAGLMGATRCISVLQTGGDRRVGAAVLPPGERKYPEALLRAIGPWLDEAGRTRAARLRHGPAGALPRSQRSCLVAPMQAGDHLLGYLYTDI